MVQFNFKEDPFGAPKTASRGRTDPKASLEGIRSFLMEHKTEASCAAGALLALVVIANFVGGRFQEAGLLSAQISELTAKEEPLAAMTRSQKEADKVFSAIPAPLPENRLISHITLIANKRGVTITSFSSPKYTNEGFYRRGTVQLACFTSRFSDALLFLNDLEISPFALKVDNWKMTSEKEKSKELGLTLTVSSLEILDNEKK